MERIRIPPERAEERHGRLPYLRGLIGTAVLRATHRMSYREMEEQIRHYPQRAAGNTE
jgi:hypothetical protein